MDPLCAILDLKVVRLFFGGGTLLPLGCIGAALGQGHELGLRLDNKGFQNVLINLEVRQFSS